MTRDEPNWQVKGKVARLRADLPQQDMLTVEDALNLHKASICQRTMANDGTPSGMMMLLFTFINRTWRMIFIES